MGAIEDLTVHVENRLAVNTTFAPDPVQFHHMSQCFPAIVAGRKGCFVCPDLNSCLDKVISIGTPQLALMFKKVSMDLPERRAILAGYTFGSERRVDAGISMIEDRPEDDPRLAGFDEGVNYLRFCA